MLLDPIPLNLSPSLVKDRLERGSLLMITKKQFFDGSSLGDDILSCKLKIKFAGQTQSYVA